MPTFNEGIIVQLLSFLLQQQIGHQDEYGEKQVRQAIDILQGIRESGLEARPVRRLEEQAHEFYRAYSYADQALGRCEFGFWNTVVGSARGFWRWRPDARMKVPSRDSEFSVTHGCSEET